jgi:predicted glycosyltransferase
MTKIWIDLLNPSHPLFFKPIVTELEKEFDIQLTIRHRAETVSLAKQLGLDATVLGSFYDEKKMKTVATVNRVITLLTKVQSFDWSISLEDSDCVAASMLRRKKSILFFDNDLKYKKQNGTIQLMENAVKLLANHIIVPKAAGYILKNNGFHKKGHIFDGYKEDVYLADFKPNPLVKEQIPFQRYVVIRPEALRSFYVHETKSLVPGLLSFFKDNDIPVVYLPREQEDMRLAVGFNVFVLKNPINGLDLCYYSDAVLTGSGTMAREAACMGKPAVSFFPGDNLLSVDEQLIEEGKMIHSREIMEIGKYILSQQGKKISTSFPRSQQVKKEVLGIIKEILQ